VLQVQGQFPLHMIRCGNAPRDHSPAIADWLQPLTSPKCCGGISVQSAGIPPLIMYYLYPPATTLSTTFLRTSYIAHLPCSQTEVEEVAGRAVTGQTVAGRAAAEQTAGSSRAGSRQQQGKQQQGKQQQGKQQQSEQQQGKQQQSEQQQSRKQQVSEQQGNYKQSVRS
jgi:hypothetical protein